MGLHFISNVYTMSVVCSDKTWVFDQSKRARGPIYIIISFKDLIQHELRIL